MSDERDKYPDVFRTTRGLDLSGLAVVRPRDNRTPVPTVVPGSQMPGSLSSAGVGKTISGERPPVASVFMTGGLLDLANVRSRETEEGGS